MFVFRNCTLLPQLTEGPVKERGDVVVREGIIESILPAGQAPAALEGMDLQGATLMPGMIDMHVHLVMAVSGNELLLRKPLERVFDCYHYAKTLLDHGYTTVRDCGDALEGPTVALGNAIESGLLDGPRIIPSCGTLCPHEPGVEVLEFIVQYINNPMDVRQYARENFQKGAQFIKIYGTGSMMAKGSEPGLRIMEPDEIIEAVKVARMKKSYVAIHAHGAEAIDIAVRNGVRTVEHASLIADETVQFMRHMDEVVGIVPTLSVFYHTFEHAENSASGEFFARQARGLEKDVRESLGNAYRQGLRVGWGTDVSMPEFLSDPFAEFRLRREKLACSNEDILKQVTIDSARLLGRDREIGSLKAGKAADLIVVEGNPLEDLSALYRKPRHVMRAGKLIR